MPTMQSKRPDPFDVLGSADDMFSFNFAHALILSPQLRASQVALTCEECAMENSALLSLRREFPGSHAAGK